MEPPREGQHIVRSLGSRGSNIIEVEFPDGRSTLCLLPAKFHKKLWICKGSYCIIEEQAAAAEGERRVTGVIEAVLYADHVKQLRRMPGVWPLEFPSSSGAANLAAEQLAAMGLVESDSEAESGAAGSSGRGGAAAAGSEAAAAGGAGGAAAAAAAGQGGGAGGEDDEGSGGSSSEDDLPPIPRFQNRKFIEYAVSSDSEDEV
ncbi:RNA-binding EIF1AD [Micractinium conductrix]|uniref:RNA-binding EIF1AD n=1 Tax=Micractinium conductrix TaxID=554055 RepID=A0A2P6VQK7_9CHLO|nr:RNA-binding EIF1AD [Micractinium conductrix]|eukprot:PSC76350.1 RNA-binding EIF1AD [Micractinium conductrix]